MRIGIFGGTFNPVHYEHIKVAMSAIDELNLDKLIIVPTYTPPHKDVVLASSTDRTNMLKLAFDGKDKVEISDFEINNGGTSYSYITVSHYASLYKGSEIFFVMGADMMINFKEWKYPEKICKQCKLAVFSREDFPFDFSLESEYIKSHFNGDAVKLKYEGLNDSSTKIRIYSALKLPIDFLTTKSVAEYILNNNLYEGGEIEDFIVKVLPEKRRIHTANVILCALKKVKELKLDYDKVYLGALLHDVAKYLDYNEFKGFSLPVGIVKPVIHAFLGAYIIENVLNIKDDEIINAVRYHTSGRPNMSTLEKLIFVADMIEDGRNYAGVEILRSLYSGNLDDCFKKCLMEEMIHLDNKGDPIFELTLKAYDYYIKGEK